MPLDEPLVSIVLPTYNGERFLSQSVASCLAQRYENLELLVVVDGATDRTREILAREVDPRLRVLDRAENHGLPASLNEGFQATRGLYLTWTSDDNLYLPGALPAMVRALEEGAGRGVHLVYAAAYEIDEQGRIRGRYLTLPPGRCLSYGNRLGPCFLFTRTLFEKTGPYDETLAGVEDYDFWLRARLHTRFHFIRRPLYLYRRHPHSLTERRAAEVRERLAVVMRRHLPLSAETQGTTVGAPDLAFFPPVRLALSEKEAAAVRRALAQEGFSAVVVEPRVPSLRRSEPACLELAAPVPGATLAVRRDHLAVLALSPKASAAAAFERVVSLGGRVGILVRPAGPDAPAEHPPAFWLRLGIVMNEVDNHALLALVRRIMPALFGRPEDARLSAYLVGMFLAKLRNAPRHLIRPRLDRLLFACHPDFRLLRRFRGRKAADENR